VSPTLRDEVSLPRIVNTLRNNFDLRIDIICLVSDAGVYHEITDLSIRDNTDAHFRGLDYDVQLLIILN
jgi:hypothetical protein